AIRSDAAPLQEDVQLPQVLGGVRAGALQDLGERSRADVRLDLAGEGGRVDLAEPGLELRPYGLAIAGNPPGAGVGRDVFAEQPDPGRELAQDVGVHPGLDHSE